jgi:hypothetical protein
MRPLEMDPDEAVQSTNDEAQASKASCVQAGYFEDNFIHYFVKKKGVPLGYMVHRPFSTRTSTSASVMCALCGVVS